MEIFITIALLLCAACIWAAWGPRVLLAVIAIPPALFMGFIIIIIIKDEVELKAKARVGSEPHMVCFANKTSDWYSEETGPEACRKTGGDWRMSNSDSPAGR